MKEGRKDCMKDGKAMPGNEGRAAPENDGIVLRTFSFSSVRTCKSNKVKEGRKERAAKAGKKEGRNVREGRKEGRKVGT